MSNRDPFIGPPATSRSGRYFDGRIERLDEDGRTGITGEGSTPIDVVITDSGKYLYSLNSGSHTIGSFRIQRDGSLTPLPFAAGLPVGANGLASR